ncbi:transmembrane protein 53 [Bicyclus anynana]|uniref:Transmembrane protein 53 n=1 Tax=Bicyclus anynana TaxID=110368 RepID=A0ABM3M0G2_BICAN|nr:transmembrane protein 53 [Bicyclus anynana]
MSRSRTLPRLLCSRSAHTQPINKNFLYISSDKIIVETDRKTLKLTKPTNKPVCIMMGWLLATDKQVMKYANIYLEEGFDVLRVTCAPWQLLWPVKGAKVIARDLLQLMSANDSTYMVHGFSVGGYVWSEAMIHALTDKKRYQPVLDRVEAQVWDSVADITEVSVGVPLAMFPHNRLAQKITKNAILAYLKALYNVGMVHYERACETFYASPCRAPALFLLSSTDPVGNERRIRRCCDLWIQMGIECTWQCWPRSPHVRHYLKHPQEYEALIRAHIRKNMSSLRSKSEPCGDECEKLKLSALN